VGLVVAAMVVLPRLNRILPAPGLPDLTPEATSVQVADGMADLVPRTNPNRELVGQGMADVAAGIFGGMPATGAIARTAVNVRAGVVILRLGSIRSSTPRDGRRTCRATALQAPPRRPGRRRGARAFPRASRAGESMMDRWT